jgi:hypothetical protein
VAPARGDQQGGVTLGVACLDIGPPLEGKTREVLVTFGGCLEQGAGGDAGIVLGA